MPNVVALIGKILVRVTPADSCDLFTEMTASYFLYQLLGVVKDAFAFQTFRREAAINASSSSVADRWKRMGKDDRNLFFRRNKVGVLPNPIFCSFLWSLSSSPISAYTHSSLLFVLALTNKGWNELWFGRIKSVVLALWKTELALNTRESVKLTVKELYSAIHERITPTIDAEAANVHRRGADYAPDEFAAEAANVHRAQQLTADPLPFGAGE